MSTPQLLKKKTNRDTNNETDTDKEANTEHQVIFNSTDEYKKRIEEMIKDRKEEAAKYDNCDTFTLPVLSCILSYDNTNSHIISSFFKKLKKVDPDEYLLQYKWRKLFVSQKDLKEINPNEPYSKKSAKEILKDIIQKTKSYQNTTEWLNETLLFMRQFQIPSPYSLREITNENNLYEYEIEKVKIIEHTKQSNNEHNNGLLSTEQKVSEENSIEIKSLTDEDSNKSSSSCKNRIFLVSNCNQEKEGNKNEIIKSKYDLCPSCIYDISYEENAYRYIINDLISYCVSLFRQDLLHDLLKVIGLIIETECSLKKVVYKIDQLLCSGNSFSLQCNLHYVLSSMNVVNFISKVDDDIMYKRMVEDNTVFLQNEKIFNEMLYQLIKAISNSNCMKTLLLDYFWDDNTVLALLNENFIKFFFDKLSYTPFFNKNDYGNTDETTLRVNINIAKREKLTIEGYPKGDILLHFFKLFLTLFHEMYGHFAQRYCFYYYPDKYQNKTEREHQESEDGGRYLETLLFGHQGHFNFPRVLFILNSENWNLDYKSFRLELKKQNYMNIKESAAVQFCKDNSLIQKLISNNNCDVNLLIKEIYNRPFSFKLKMEGGEDNKFEFNFNERLLGPYFNGNKIH